MKKVFIKTYGCVHNRADSELMAGLLSKNSFKIVDSQQIADLVLVNSCTVKDPSEKKLYSFLKKIKQPVVVAGCVPQADKNNDFLIDYSLLGVKQIHKIAEVAEQTIAGNKVHLLQKTKNSPLNLPRIRRNKFVEMVPISNGCMGYCSFCKTKFARGKLSSFKENDVVEHVRTALNDGVKEIWITSEDIGAYGLDIGTTLPSLLRKILLINRDFKIRLGMINPEYVVSYSAELIDIFNDDRLYKFLHVPLQSGNNRILKLMKRAYTIEEFKASIKKINIGVSGITIATDIICGFPSETVKEFNDTINAVKEFKFQVLNISKFYPRKGTAAAGLKLLSTKIVKTRSKLLTTLNKSLDIGLEKKGFICKIFVSEHGKKGSFVGRDDFYRPVIVEGKELLGKVLKVKIISVLRNYSVAEIINVV